MPQGGIDAGEDPLAAALRELYEETNVRSASLIAEAPEWLTYDLPEERAQPLARPLSRPDAEMVPVPLRGRGGRDRHPPPAGGAHKPEFDAWRWERFEALPDLVVPFKREVYVKVVALFAPLAKPA